jgi:hypothetical protein
VFGWSRRCDRRPGLRDAGEEAEHCARQEFHPRKFWTIALNLPGFSMNMK